MKEEWPLLAFLIVMLSFTFLILNSEMPVIAQTKHNAPIGEIHSSITVGQTFLCTENNLNRIDVLLATYARINTEDVIFHLREWNSSQDLVKIVVNAKEIKDNSYHVFRFEPIRDSRGKMYYFFIESPNSTPGNAITVWYSTEDVYENGVTYLNHKPVSGDLHFRVYCKSNINLVISNFTSRIQQDKPFFMFYFLLLILILSIIIIYVKNRPK